MIATARPAFNCFGQSRDDPFLYQWSMNLQVHEAFPDRQTPDIKMLDLYLPGTLNFVLKDTVFVIIRTIIIFAFHLAQSVATG